MNALTSHTAQRTGMVLVAIASTLMLLGAAVIANEPGQSGTHALSLMIWGTATFFAWRKVKRMKQTQQVVDPSTYEQQP